MNEQELFLSALDISDPAERQAHLQATCADEPELLARVESLLASHESQSQFLNTPVVNQMADEPTEEASATVISESGSTQDDEFETADFNPDERDAMTQHIDDQSDEIPLGYLEPSSKPDSIGCLAHYEIQKVIGRGAFGTVLKAFDEKLQRVVAIKVLAPEMAATSPARKRFLREARSSAAVRDDNVVAIYAVDEKPIPYLVMEYIPGMTLQQRLDQQGPLDLAEVLRLGKQIADGLAAAHAKQLIHRDVKPGNILLETSINDHVKITDFGLARAADDASMTQSGMIAGTPLYMAPEQALGQKLDQRADLFSFGSVLYQMLTGRPPFRASNTLAVLKRVTEDTPRPIQEIIPEIPAWMCEIVARLHAKDPDDRYGSAKEIADLLGRCLTELERGNIPNIEALVTESSATLKRLPAENSVTRSRRSRRPLLKFAVIALLLAILGVAIKWPLTPSGKPGIETDDADVTIAIDRNGNLVTDPAQPDPVKAPAAPPVAKAPFDEKQAKQHQKAWAEHLGVPVEKEIILGKDHKGEDLKLTMVLIPPGDFLMGTNGREISDLVEEAETKNPDARTLLLRMEGPQHFVKITKPFWLSKYEFKTGLFRRFVESTGYRTTAETDGIGGARVVNGKPVRDPDVYWDMLKGTRGDFGPVVNVSYNDALACCAWLSKQHPEMAFSLPTEAQWEFACRAGATTPWHGCKTAEELEQYAWFDSNAKWIQGGGRLKPNAFGLYDMHGNVWEWCLDWMSGMYGESPSIDPVRLEDVEHPLRVNRGGSFMNPANTLRSAKRGATPPDNSFFDRGFRVAAEVVPKGRQPNSSPAAVTENYGLSFDGKDDYVEIPSLKPAVDSPMTVEVICRVVDLNQSTLVDFGSRKTSEFVLRTEAQQWRFERSAGSKWISTRGANGLKPDHFVHIAGVWDGSRLSLFINGVLQPGSNDTNASRQRTQLERLLIGGLGQGIGNESAPPTECFGGMLKALRISRSARYTSRFTAPTDFKTDEQTLAVYQFHSGTGNVLRDTSGNGHHGTIHGATWVQTDGTPLTDINTEGNVTRKAKRRFTSDEWIDVVSLIDPKLDAPDHSYFGKNEWGIEDGELVVGETDTKPKKLIFPVDAAWPAFECEVEFTRRAGSVGFGVNIPASKGNCPVAFDWDKGVRIGTDPLVKLKDGQAVIETGKRTSVRFVVRRQGDADRVSVWCDEKLIGDWNIDRQKLAYDMQESYPYERRSSIYLPEGERQFVFHKIRLRMLDGGTATTLRPVSAVPAKTIDLILLIDGNQENIRKQNGVLVLRDIPFSNLVASVSYEPVPREYDLHLVVERSEGRSTLGIGIPYGSHQGMVVIDGWGGKTTGLEAIDGKTAGNADNPTSVQDTFLPQGERVPIAVAVRRGSIRLQIGERVIFSWAGRPEQLTLTKPWAKDGTDSLFLGAQVSEFAIHKFTLTPFVRYEPEVTTSVSGSGTVSFNAEQAKQHQQAWADYLGVSVEKEVVIGQDFRGSDVKLTMVLIPPGEFLMGSSEKERAPSSSSEIVRTFLRLRGNEHPQHRVRINRPFRLSRHEVTIGQFRQFASQSGYRTDAERDGKGGYGLVDGQMMMGPQFVWSSDRGFPWQGPRTENYPVANLSWNDAAKFCEWLSQQSGRLAFALPTEAQWEYACRAGTTTKWHFGDSEPELGNYRAEFGAAVGQSRPNAFGLFDMHGNVWEWCADVTSKDYYSTSPPDDPTGLSSGDRHVQRGGAALTPATTTRSAYRILKQATHRHFESGFRVAAAISDDVLRATLPAASDDDAQQIAPSITAEPRKSVDEQ